MSHESSQSASKARLVSVVIPVYYNEENIPVTWAALRESLESLPQEFSWEVVFVDDGSGDRSYEALGHVFASCPDRVRVVKLTRNFGQHGAILAGFRQARGGCCVVMSADLQDPPELIPEMVKRWAGSDTKIVLAARRDRDDGRIAAWTSQIFYRLMRRYAIPNMPAGGFDFFLIDRRVVDFLDQVQEKNSFLQGQILWTGFEPDVLYYSRRKRELGRSRWTLSMRLKYFLDGFVNYSVTPIRLITLVGLMVSLLSFGYALVIIGAVLFLEAPVRGWATMMVSILMLAGVQMVMLGIIGEYMWRNSHETSHRPNFVVERTLGESEPGTGDSARPS